MVSKDFCFSFIVANVKSADAFFEVTILVFKIYMLMNLLFQ